jgi:hypothetical protein
MHLLSLAWSSSVGISWKFMLFQVINSDFSLEKKLGSGTNG